MKIISLSLLCNNICPLNETRTYKTMKKLSFIMIIALLIVSCNSRKNNQSITSLEIIKIDNLDNDEKICLDSITEVKLIPFSRPDSQTYIGRIKKIVLLNNTIYISDGRNLFLYDMNGKCKLIFNKRGKAKGEYLGIGDFELINSNFYIIDEEQRTLLSYQNDGKLIHSFQLNFRPKSIKKLDHSALIICAENDIIGEEEKMKFHTYDINKNEIVHSFCPVDIHKGTYLKHLWNNNYTVINDSLFYYEPNDNTILHITQGNYQPYLTFDFGKNEPPTEFYQKDHENVATFFYEFHENQYASGTYWAIWNESKILFQFIHNKELKVALIDRSTKYAMIYQEIFIKNVNLGEIYTYDDNLLSYIYLNETTGNENSESDLAVIIAKLKK